MPDDKNSRGEQFTGKPEDAANLVRAVGSAEAERRMTALESHVGKLESSLLERHAKLITIIFSGMAAFVAVCAILVTVLGWLSKSGSDTAAREMKHEVKGKMEEFEKRFQALAGEALKKPLIQIFSESELLDGKIFETETPSGQARVGTLFLKNSGNKSTEALSMRLFFSSTVSISGGAWETVPSNDKDFPSSFYLYENRQITLAPEETWSLVQHFAVAPVTPLPTNVIAKLQVFYGTEKPAEARFNIRVKR